MMESIARMDAKPLLLRITETPALYGLVVRERGQLVEYVSYRVAQARMKRRATSRVR